MKKKNLPIIEHVRITGVAAEGKALVRIQSTDRSTDRVQTDSDEENHSDGIVCFVANCVPGDIVDLQVTKKKHSFMEAKVLRMVEPSAIRCEARCKHFGVCGGCKWQILPYEEQLKYKQQQIVDNLTRIGKITVNGERLEDSGVIQPILGSKHIYEYRNKLEFTCADRKWIPWEVIEAAGGLDKIDSTYGLGFHIPNAFDKVLDIEDCHLMPEINNRIRNSVRAYAKEHGLSFYNEHTHEGLLRTIILRNNHKGEMMVVFCFGEKIEDWRLKIEDFLEYIHQTFPEIISLLYVENTKFNDTIGDLEVKTYFGQDYIMEEMEGLQFKVGPKSFYQTNTEQAYELYKVARDFAQLTGDELVYDLYTGTGTIANFVSRKARQVIGIEYVPEAIEDAKVNSQINGIENTLFFAGDMKKVLNDAFVAQYGRPDVIITDPPRAGMDPEVVDVILKAAPKRIVYVSCNPATQARDLALLDAQYEVKKIQPVDMFPHTQHVENVVLLEQR